MPSTTLRTTSRRVQRPATLTAKTADRYELYQMAVQSPEDDIAFLVKAYRRWRRKTPRHLREDFCGTALLAATWVAAHPERTAEGFDLDPEPIAWGLAHNVEPIGKAAARLELHLKDVRARGHRPADLRIAQNFSYSTFKTRRDLLGYFRAAHADLAPDGMFAIDVYGGLDATAEIEEPRRIERGVTYVWEQARHLPSTGDYLCHIHFRFRDGTRMSKAFTYDWRFWNLTELRDLLQEAGFRALHTYFEQTDDDEDGDGNGDFVLDETGETARDCGGWVAYVVALK